MTEFTFGRYSSYNTPLHRLDARNKIIMMILLFVVVFLQFNVWSTTLIMSGLILIGLFVIMIISKVRLRSLLKTIKTMWFLILFLFLMYVLLPNSTYTRYAFNLWGLKVYWDAFYQCGYILLRLLMMLCITMTLTSTTKPMDLTRGLEWWMTPLKLVKFPVHIVSMIISIALRFIPTILEETSRIMKAQESRGVDFTHGSLKVKFRAVVSLIIPLFISSIDRSEELANAMEARGYDPNAKRTSYQKLRFHLSDLFALLIVLLIFGGVLTLFIFDKNVGTVNLIKIIFGVEPLF